MRLRVVVGFALLGLACTGPNCAAPKCEATGLYVDISGFPFSQGTAFTLCEGRHCITDASAIHNNQQPSRALSRARSTRVYGRACISPSDPAGAYTPQRLEPPSVQSDSSAYC